MRSTRVWSWSWSMALVALWSVPGCTFDDGFGGCTTQTPGDPFTDAEVSDAPTYIAPADAGSDASAADTAPECIAGGGTCVLDRDCCTGGCSGVAASGARYCVDAPPPGPTSDAGPHGGGGDDAAATTDGGEDHGGDASTPPGSDGSTRCLP